LSANLPIGVPPDEQLQDLNFALGQPNPVTRTRRRGLVSRALRRLRWPLVSQQRLQQAFEPGFVLQQCMVKVFQQFIVPTVRHAAHASADMAIRDQLSGVHGTTASCNVRHA
jgi:hypothetical protein